MAINKILPLAPMYGCCCNVLIACGGKQHIPHFGASLLAVRIAATRPEVCVVGFVGLRVPRHIMRVDRSCAMCVGV